MCKVEKYLAYKEQTKKYLQFTPDYLFQCLQTLIFSFIIFYYDKYNLIQRCSDKEELILKTNLVINFILYLKFIIFVYLYLLSGTERLFRNLFLVLTIILVEVLNSIINIAIAFYEMIMDNCYIKLFDFKLIYLNDRFIKIYMQHGNLQISFILHIILAVLIMRNLIQLIKFTFSYIDFLKFEKDAFRMIKNAMQV